MNYYVIQVKTRDEEKYVHLVGKAFHTAGVEDAGRIILPRRKLETRRGGRKKDVLLPLYPGYVFYRSESLQTEVYWLLRRIPGFFRFLRGSGGPEPLSGEDEEILVHFLSYGETVETSRVYFDENDKIRVISGPLSGLEGKIVKVDKRKRRAKVQLSLYDNFFPVDFSFELMEQAVSKP